MPRSSTDDPPPGPSSHGPVLRRLDDALVPRLQRVAGWASRVAGWPARALRRLDDRLAGGRPARMAREHRGLVALVIVAIVFAAAVVNLQRYPELRARSAQATGTDTREPAGTTDDPTGRGEDHASVGPPVGAPVEPWVEARREALAAAETGQGRVAVVSFAEFRTAEAVGDVLGDLEAIAVEYRLPERTPRPDRVLVDGTPQQTIGRLVDDLVRELEQERETVESTLETVESEEFRADFEARLDELAALRNTLLQDPSIVFAVVVRGRVEVLRGVAADDTVRLVDLAPPDVAPAVAEQAHGLLPTDREQVSHGRRS